MKNPLDSLPATVLGGFILTFVLVALVNAIVP